MLDWTMWGHRIHTHTPTHTLHTLHTHTGGGNAKCLVLHCISKTPWQESRLPELFIDSGLAKVLTLLMFSGHSAVSDPGLWSFSHLCFWCRLTQPFMLFQGTGKWYELQDLQVTDILPQMITLSEAYIQVGVAQWNWCRVLITGLGASGVQGDQIMWLQKLNRFSERKSTEACKSASVFVAFWV